MAGIRINAGPYLMAVPSAIFQALMYSSVNCVSEGGILRHFSAALNLNLMMRILSEAFLSTESRVETAPGLRGNQ